MQPGHQGIWSEPLRTGKYTLNPRIYEAEIVPTSILTLNWSHATSDAHSLDEHLAPIDAKSREAFTFSIDLQVQIHVPDTRAPKVISMVGTMKNLVNEVLQSAVGNYFRNKLQTLGAAEFIEKRDEVQHAAESYIQQYLSRYEVETRGVYIQDVVFPADLVEVLTTREIASQERATFAQQQTAQEARVEPRAAAGRGRHAGRAGPGQRVGRHREGPGPQAAEARAQGEAAVITTTGNAEATRTQAIGEATAAAEEALGPGPGQGLRGPARGHRGRSRRRWWPPSGRSAPATSRSSPTSSSGARAASSAGSAPCSCATWPTPTAPPATATTRSSTTARRSRWPCRNRQPWPPARLPTTPRPSRPLRRSGRAEDDRSEDDRPGPARAVHA